MDTKVLSQWALSRAKAAAAEGDNVGAWEWLQQVPVRERPAALMAACLDALSLGCADKGLWGRATEYAERALRAQHSPWRQERLDLLRRRSPYQSDQDWELLRSKIAPAQHLVPGKYAPDLDAVAACGAYYSRTRSDTPWSKYLRLGKSAWTEDDDRAGAFQIAGKHLTRFVAQETDFLSRTQVVVPVPANPSRYTSRRGSLPAELAAAATRHLALPGYEFAVAWRLASASVEMKKLSWGDRAAAAETMFTAGRQADKVRGLAVLLVDDITTSGATLRAAARVLRANGATSVLACCLAHTEG